MGSKTKYYSYSLSRKDRIHSMYVFIKKINYTKSPGDLVIRVSCTS